MDGVWWWRCFNVGRFHGWLAPDLRPYPAVQELLNDTQIVRDGLGDLLLRSHMQDDGIAILYSYPSTFACKLDERPTYGTYEASHKEVYQLVRDLGLQFRYVTDRQLKNGEFDSNHFKVLLLLRADALGNQEGQTIREFVQNGGTVIADLRPGLYDDHCKPRDKGVLDDLFGITGGPRSRGMALLVGPLGCKVKVDRNVKLSGGEAVWGTVGETPLGIKRKVGKGLVFLLNFDLGSYAILRDTNAPDLLRDEVLSLFERSQVRPSQRIVNNKGERLALLETIRWSDGDTEIMALFREGGTSEPATVTLAEARSVFDLRNRKSLGLVKDFKTTVIANRATFFAICKQVTPSPRISFNETTASPGSVAMATISDPENKGFRAYRIRAQVNGQKLEWLNQNLLVGKDPVTFAIPIAYNDPVGEYQISATELFSNEPATAILRVR